MRTLQAVAQAASPPKTAGGGAAPPVRLASAAMEVAVPEEAVRADAQLDAPSDFIL